MASASSSNLMAASAPLATSPFSQREMRDWFTPMASATSACDMLRRKTFSAAWIGFMRFIMHYRITKRKHLIRYSIGSVGTLAL